MKKFHVPSLQRVYIVCAHLKPRACGDQKVAGRIGLCLLSIAKLYCPLNDLQTGEALSWAEACGLFVQLWEGVGMVETEQMKENIMEKGQYSLFT